MILGKLAEEMKRQGISAERLAKKSNGDFCNMTVRRAIKGCSIRAIYAAAIAKRLGVSVKGLQ